ncbi:MAG: hypothetical protein LRY35_00815 [Clostridiales bacterium]|nr:hypothetical protein [Clostridiales bacterium]
MLKILYHKHEIIGLDRVQPNAPVVFISNHAGNYGPIVLSLYFPRLFYPWVASEMLSKNSISNYMDLNFTQKIMKLKPPISTWVTKILAFFVLRVLKDFHSIPVYRGQMRIRETINQSIRTLQQGIDLVIFPETRSAHFQNTLAAFISALSI